MWNLLWLTLFCCSAVLVTAQRSNNATSKWQTLSGKAPLVVARGGFSGLFPDSSFNAYALAQAVSLPNWIAWCDVQLTKDGAGICLRDIRLNNASDIDIFYKDRQSTYVVNGVPLQGWFSIDFNLKDLNPVSLKQAIYSRTFRFDGTPQQILTVQDVVTQVQPPELWLNIQHDSFYRQHNLSMRSFVISLSKNAIINYISSPEVDFLRSIVPRFNPRVTKLVFRFLDQDDTEPSTNQTYGSLLKNLTFIKTFASGILVPKYYIWPVVSLYLQPHTSVVLDAHKEGLEIFAADFDNDVPFAYNYSYDPVAEYLSFIDNGEFSVDGVLSEFPITPSASVDCFSHLGKNDKPQAKLLIITSEGASGDYPGCTDLAYTKAASDGADVLDCPVQMTKDGIPFCLGSINMIDRTTAAQSQFSNIATTVPELNITNAILTISLTWSEVQSLNLNPAISNPWSDFRLYRNPKARNEGNFMSLADFLTFAKNASSVSGVLISIENAAYLAKQGLGVTDAVLEALSKAGYNNQTAKKVMIQSTDSSVLEEFKKSSYELVYGVVGDIDDIDNKTILEIKTFAKSVIVTKRSVFPPEDAFLVRQTNVVQKLQSSNLPVYVRLFNNEFVSQPWDFFSDSSVELNNYNNGAGIDGVITEYPRTAARYRRNRCLGYKELPPYMTPVQPGSLLGIMAHDSLPPAEAPNPVLTENDVVEPPLPPVAKINPANDNGSTAKAPTAPPSGQSSIVASIFTSSVAILLATIIAS